VSQPLAQILSKMVLSDYKQRYQSASEVLEALDELTAVMDRELVAKAYTSTNNLSAEDYDNPTTPWPGGS
jgi:hypothetical protein